MATSPKPTKSNNQSEEKTRNENASIEQVADGPNLAESRSEKKRNREQKRRNQVNEGLDKLTELVFIIDPELKAAAQARAAGNVKVSINDGQLLSRVELVNSAVSTLARVHQENEMNKMLLAQLTRGAGPTNMTPPTAMGLAGLGGGRAPVLYQSLVNQHFSRESVAAAAASLGAMTSSTSPLVRQTNNKNESSEGKEPEEGGVTQFDDKTREGGPATKRLKKRREN